MDGLQESSPNVDLFCVIKSVRAPVRADAVAASVPACPPPMTMTSYEEEEDCCCCCWWWAEVDVDLLREEENVAKGGRRTLACCGRIRDDDADDPTPLPPRAEKEYFILELDWKAEQQQDNLLEMLQFIMMTTIRRMIS